jgi:hypothetical protein
MDLNFNKIERREKRERRIASFQKFVNILNTAFWSLVVFFIIVCFFVGFYMIVIKGLL